MVIQMAELEHRLHELRRRIIKIRTHYTCRAPCTNFLTWMSLFNTHSGVTAELLAGMRAFLGIAKN
jgi:hypothetical protein